jgi:DNA polymerase
MRKVGNRYMIAMFHPAAALHQSSLKPAILADFAKLPKLLEEARKGLGRIAPELNENQEAPMEDPKQLNLF